MKRIAVIAVLAISTLFYQNCAQNNMTFDYEDSASALGIGIKIIPDASNIHEVQKRQKYTVEVKVPENGTVQRENISVNGKRVDYLKNAFGNYEFSFVAGSPIAYEIMAEVWSPNGTRFEAKEELVITDEMAPTIVITPYPANKYEDLPGLAQSFAVTVTDLGGGVISSTACHINADPIDCALDNTGKMVVTTTGLRGGLYKLYVDASDNFKNTSREVFTFSIGADLVAPILKITANPANSGYSIDQHRFTLSAVDTQTGLQSVSCKLNGKALATCPSVAGGSVELVLNDKNFVEGLNTIELAASDKAVKGNVSSPNTSTVSHTFDILVDRDAPTVRLAAGQSNSGLVNQVQTVAFEIKDAGSGIKPGSLVCKVAGATVACQANSNGTGEISFSPSAPGTVAIEVSVQDRYDNAGAASLSLDINRDANVPVVTITEHTSNPSVILEGATLRFNFNVRKDGNLSTLTAIRCYVESTVVNCNAAANLQSGTFSGTFPTEGKRVVRVEATDSTGNVGQRSYEVEVKKLVSSSTRLTVNEIRELDVLIVIDDSGSMKEEQANMAQRIGSFTSKISALDWRAAVITTDIYDQSKMGKLQPIVGLSSRYWVTKETPNNQKLIGDTVQGVGIKGNGAEQGIKAAHLLLDARTTAPNVGFFRENAALAVLFISDENESANTPKNIPASLVSAVQNAWPGKPFRAHSIVMLPSKCVGYSVGTSYITLSNLTGGRTGCVGDADYGATLAAMGQASAEAVNSATLACEPYNRQVTITRGTATQNVSYTVSGRNLTFATNLPVGQYQLNYSCVQ